MRSCYKKKWFENLSSNLDVTLSRYCMSVWICPCAFAGMGTMPNVPMMPSVPILTPIPMTTMSPMPGMTPMMGTRLSVPVMPIISTPALPNGPIAILQPTPIPLTSSKRRCMPVKLESSKIMPFVFFCDYDSLKIQCGSSDGILQVFILMIFILHSINCLGSVTFENLTDLILLNDSVVSLWMCCKAKSPCEYTVC